MTAAVGLNTANSWSYASGAYGAASSGAASNATKAANADTTPRDSNATSVTLSEEAKAYLAASTAEASSATLAANARQWFDQQYAALGISSAVLDGEIAVDLTGQDRATLSVVASSTAGQFSQDEIDAAIKTLQVRFDDAVSPYVVIARHTGDYAAPYDAALNYLNKAGVDEQATPAWKNEYQAVLDGLAAAKSAFGKAPDTGNPNDPVRALLGRTSSSGSSPATDSAGIASQARSMLDAQANSARDNGTDLTFDRSRSTGQQVDFTDFNNRSLATIALNQNGEFSVQETRSAKVELDQRNRASILEALNGSQSSGDTRSSSLALLKQITAMSDEEKSVMGYTDAFVGRIAQNYRTLTSLQGAIGSNSATSLLSQL
ncbi:MAG: hypothetical protein ABIL01_04420 [Pseudomonadota bacterium]